MLSNLQKVRKSKDVSMKQIANLLGVRIATVSDKINGKSNFTFDEALKIQKVFFPEYTLEYLFKKAEPVLN